MIFFFSLFWFWGVCACDAIRLEQESGYFFNIRHFEDLVTSGNWDEVEMYLSGFTKVDDNRYSMKIFFEIRKQKYLEALDRYFSNFTISYASISLQNPLSRFKNVII